MSASFALRIGSCYNGTAMASGEILRVEGVTKEFESLTAVAGVSFEVRRGEIFGLLGPNGAGKTTLIRMILGIFQPDAGRISYLGDDRPGPLPKEVVGYLPEERGLYEDRRVGETLLYLAALHGRDLRRARERALYWLDRLELGDRFQSRLRELSKGMQQKVQFIASVLHEPELAVLDEPFSGLDPPSQDLFLELIRDLAHQGMTVLLSSHQMNLVESLCDRVFLIHRGRQVLYGDLDRIKREHGIHVVRLRVHPTDPETLRQALSQGGAARLLSLDGEQAELILPREVSTNRFLRSLLEALEIEELEIKQPSLHRIFVEVVQEES
jgi:ABC-2 type transport system ATP-binding protein